MKIFKLGLRMSHLYPPLKKESWGLDRRIQVFGYPGKLKASCLVKLTRGVAKLVQ
jgi:hypothetical protein